MKNLYTAVIPGGCTSLILMGGVQFEMGFYCFNINIFMGWGCNQEWGSNGADTVTNNRLRFPWTSNRNTKVSQR